MCPDSMVTSCMSRTSTARTCGLDRVPSSNLELGRLVGRRGTHDPRPRQTAAANTTTTIVAADGSPKWHHDSSSGAGCRYPPSCGATRRPGDRVQGHVRWPSGPVCDQSRECPCPSDGTSLPDPKNGVPPLIAAIRDPGCHPTVPARLWHTGCRQLASSACPRSMSLTSRQCLDIQHRVERLRQSSLPDVLTGWAASADTTARPGRAPAGLRRCRSSHARCQSTAATTAGRSARIPRSWRPTGSPDSRRDLLAGRCDRAPGRSGQQPSLAASSWIGTPPAPSSRGRLRRSPGTATPRHGPAVLRRHRAPAGGCPR